MDPRGTKNMGAYTHIKNNLEGIDLKYIGRDEMAVTAEGLLKSHKKEQERIISRVKIMNKKPIIVPEIGESIKSATIISWQVKPGEYVKDGETLFEIESEKVTMEVPATCNGFLEKDGLKNAGENVNIGQVV